LGAAAEMLKQQPDLKFEVAAASESMRDWIEMILSDAKSVRCKIGLRNSHELMQRACAGMVASGTATMEAAFFRMPFVVIYRAAWFTFFFGRKLVKVQWLGMPNILA